MKWLLIIALAAACGSSLIFLVWRPTGQSPEQPAASGRSAPSSAGVFEGIGYVEPASEVRRLMARTGGVIRSCAVRQGDVVRKGDLLLELDGSTQRADVELARTQLAQARADAADVGAGVNPYRLKVLERTLERLREKLRHARAEVERYEKLAGQGVSKQEYALAVTRRSQCEIELREQEAELLHLHNFVTPEKKALLAASIDQASARLRLAEERLKETRVTAPCDGTVLKLLKREGEGVSTFFPEPLLLFGDLSRLRVRAEIDERFVQRLRVGQKAEVYGRNLAGKTYAGKISEVEKIMGDKTVFTRAASERKDLNVLQVVIDMEDGFTAPVGLQVDVRIQGISP
jgi:ABC exporter DevB family membrane fusion protein